MLLPAAIAVGVFAILSSSNPAPTTTVPEPIRIDVIVTATPDPNATVPVIIVTATPRPGEVLNVPPDVVETNAPHITPPTLDPTVFSDQEDDPIAATVAALPPNCIPHVVQEGDTPFGIAEQYGANGFQLMAVNGLTEETAVYLQVGDVLIVPLEGCELEATPLQDIPTETPATTDVQTAADGESTPESEEATPDQPTPTPTITLAPTTVNAQVEILQVIGAGDITSEAVEIQNNGEVVNIAGWTLSDADGNVYVFPERLFFTGGSITIHTGFGEDTAIALFWGRDEAVFQPGDVVVLANAEGDIQATLRIPEPVDLGN